MSNDNIVLPSEIKDQFNEITPEEMSALRWVGYLFVYNILSKKVSGFVPFLSDAELINAGRISEMYQFDNQMIRGSSLWCVAGLIEQGLVPVTALEHIENFFDDLLKMGVKG